ncbi:MAG: hypothetical protein WD877_01285 [Candidatus Saccharimonadales bacterium]
MKLRRKLTILLSFAITGMFLWYFLPHIQAAVNNDGVHFYGDAANLGQQKFQTYTSGSPGSMGSEINGTSTTSSAIQFVAAKAAPMRQEKIIGQQKADGRLDILKCVDACSAAGDMTSQWNTTVLPTNTVTQAFDIAYEQQSGRAMVVYGSNGVTGKLYYCLYDGTSWGPVSNCAPTDGTNDITLNDGTTSLTGSPRWVKLAAYGEQMGDKRSNEILLAVSDTNNDLYVTRWTGTAWSTTDDKVVSTNLSSITTRPFDVAWETLSGTAMITYGEYFSIINAGTLLYRTSTGVGWGGALSIVVGLGGIEDDYNWYWVKLASHPLSNRIALFDGWEETLAGFGLNVSPRIWKSDGSTADWTSGSDQAPPNLTGENLSVAWEKANTGTPQALFVTTGTLANSYNTWTNGTGFSGWFNATGNNVDTINGHQLFASPNSDEIMNIKDDIDCAIRAQEWGGSSFESLISTNMENSTITTTSGCSVNTQHAQRAWSFTYKPYAAWSMNWRWYDDEITAGNPTTALAAESTTATISNNNSVRLRFNLKEAGGMSQTDTRKKLQYSTGAGCPDSLSCTWTDVGAQGSGTAWRYADGGLTDDAAVPSSLLTGSTANGNAVENGTAAAANSDHSASTVREYDYTLQNNGASAGTYYFRVYDLGASASGGSLTDLNPLLRYQIKNTSGTEQSSCTKNGSSAVCEYPTATVGDTQSPPAAPTLSLPADTITNLTTRPEFQLRTTDADNDYLQYKIDVCSTSNCSSIVRTINQVDSQSGWFNQDQQIGSAYTGSSTISGSTMAMHRYLHPPLDPNTQYWWRAYAIDPGGSNIFSSSSAIFSFTTASLEVRIEGGTNIVGGTAIGN